MTKISWDQTGSRLFETGIDNVVFYTKENLAYPWNGIKSIVEEQALTNEQISFIDGHRYINELSMSDFSATINAYTYPDILGEYTGETDLGYTNQPVKQFNLAYRTLIGNDINGIDYGYKIHLVYNALAVPTTHEYTSFGGSITPSDFSWSTTSIPITIPNFKPTSHIIIDSTKTQPQILSIVEDYIYGTPETEPLFPSIDELIAIFEDNSIFRIIDHGDGTFTAIGNDDAISLVEPTIFQLNESSVKIISSDTYTAATL